MTAVRARLVAAVGLAASVLAGCAAPVDDDGELLPAAAPHPAPTQLAEATPVVVDSDLGGDDLVALAFLLRHPTVDVQAVTIAATGLVGCEDGVRVVAGLFEALGEPAVPVGCGRAAPGPGGRPFPAAWREAFVLAGLDIPHSGRTENPWSVSYDCLLDRSGHQFTVEFEGGRPASVSVDG